MSLGQLKSFLATPDGRKLVRVGLPLAVVAVLLITFAGRPATTPSPTVSAQPVASASTVTAAGAARTPLSIVSTAAAQEASPFNAEQRKAIEAIIKDYLLKNPEVMLEIQQVLETKMEAMQAERMKKAVSENAEQLFKAANAPMGGNPKGDVTIVEFFDYNCGYCKRALPDVTKALAKDNKIKMVLKELPILSKGSEEAARVALAARLQGKYWEVHQALLSAPGQANEANALKVAEKLGLNMAKLKQDMRSAEVNKELEDTKQLAARMGIQGTPHFLVGDRVIPGAPDNLSELLGKHVAEIRKEGCKVC